MVTNPTEELGDILVTILLCNHFNQGNMNAVKKCCRKIRKRTKTKQLKKMLGVWVRLDNPEPAITAMINLYNKEMNT